MRIGLAKDRRILQRSYGDMQLLAGPGAPGALADNADWKMLRLLPGLSTSHHYHLRSESFFLVLAGTVRVVSHHGGVDAEAVPGTCVVVDPFEDHVFTNSGSATALVLESQSPPYSADDTVPVGANILVRRPRRKVGRFWQPSTRPRLKICGVKNFDTALECERLGVDAIGIHAVGRRGVQQVLEWAEWIRVVPEELSVFILTNAVDLRIVTPLVERTGCDTLQLQGGPAVGETTRVKGYLVEVGVKMVQTVSWPEKRDFTEMCRRLDEVQRHCDAVLVDTAPPYGGTGRTHDWSVTAQLRDAISKPLIVAGGLARHNCAEAIRLMRPYGLDVESSVEASFPRRLGRRLTAKRFDDIAALVAEVRHASGPTS